MKTLIAMGLCLKDKTLYFLYKLNSEGKRAPYPYTFNIHQLRKMNREGNFLSKNEGFEKILKKKKVLFTTNHKRWWE